MPNYSVAVDLTLTGGIVTALEAVAAKFMGVNAAALKVGESIEGWGKALRNVGAALIGAGILVELNNLAARFDKTADAIARMNLQGYDPKTIKDQAAFADAISRRTGVGREAVTRELTALQYYAADPEHARRLLEPSLQMGIVLKAASGGKISQEKVTPIMKLMEETGLISDPARQGDLDKVLQRLTKAMAAAATGGKVLTPEMIQQAGVYMRQARYGITSPEALREAHPFLTDILPYYAQMAGGQAQTGGGSGIMSMFTKTVMGSLSRKSIRAAGEYDLLEDGKLKGGHLASINPYEWVQQVLVPALKAKGLTDALTQTPEITKAISDIFQTRLAADPATSFATQGRAYRGEASPYERHLKRMEQATGLEGAKVWQETSPTAALERLSSQWDNFMLKISEAINPDRLAVIKTLSDAFQKLAEATAKVDPKTIEAIAGALAALGVTLAGGAIISTLNLLVGPAGLIAALGTALLALSPQVRQAIADLTAAIGTADIGKITEAGLKLAGSILTALIQGLDSAIAAAVPVLQSAGKKLADAISTQVQSDLEAFRKKIWGDQPGIVEQLKPLMPKQQSMPGGGGVGGMLQKTGWEPGGGGKTMAINNVIYLDGSAIARAVHDYMVNDVEHPRQAPYFDGREGYTSPDHAPISA